jgi:superfamily II DNA/RNA helicase
LPPTLEHAFLVCHTKDKKLATLRRILPKLKHPLPSKKILVFCDPSRPMEEMAMAIANDLGGVYYQDGRTNNDDKEHQSVVSVLRLEDSLSQRAGATNAFAAQAATTTISVMLTHDLAARGLDIAGITHVVHFDLPSDADTYLHRSGRAGRLGQSGQVVSIITPDQEFVLTRLSNALHLPDLKCVGRQKN